MSLLKLAALGAEVLDILERDENWNSDTFDLIQTRISLLGMSTSDDEGMFKVASDYNVASLRLYEDLETSMEDSQQPRLMVDAGAVSGASVTINNRRYEL